VEKCSTRVNAYNLVITRKLPNYKVKSYL